MKSQTFIFVLTALISLLSCAQLIGQDWQLRKENDGIKIYVKEVQSSSFDAFKAEMIVQSTPERVGFILRNQDQFSHIFPDTETLKILSRDGNRSLIQYSKTSAPWPLDDRDGIYEMTFYPLENGGFYTTGRALPDRLPEYEGIVRIRKSKSTWRAEPFANGKVRIIYEVEAEPGGTIPDWLANSAITEIPYRTMSALRKELLNGNL
jgi:hypothetical protein